MSKTIYIARLDFENGGFIINGVGYYSIINKIIVDNSYELSEPDWVGNTVDADFLTYEEAANWSISILKEHLEYETNKVNKAIKTLETRMEAYVKN